MINNKWTFNCFVIVCIIFASCATTKNAEGQKKVPKKAQSLFNEGLKMQGYGEYQEAQYNYIILYNIEHIFVMLIN